MDDQDLNAEDEEALSYFMSKEAPSRATLANLIMDKVKEKETEIMTLASEKGELGPQRTMNPKVVAVYEGFAVSLYVIIAVLSSCLTPPSS